MRSDCYAARAAADARLPLGEQAEAAVALLLEQCAEAGRIASAERDQAERRRSDERGARRKELVFQVAQAGAARSRADDSPAVGPR